MIKPCSRSWHGRNSKGYYLCVHLHTLIPSRKQSVCTKLQLDIMKLVKDDEFAICFSKKFSIWRRVLKFRWFIHCYNRNLAQFIQLSSVNLYCIQFLLKLTNVLHVNKPDKSYIFSYLSSFLNIKSSLTRSVSGRSFACQILQKLYEKWEKKYVVALLPTVWFHRDLAFAVLFLYSHSDHYLKKTSIIKRLNVLLWSWNQKNDYLPFRSVSLFSLLLERSPRTFLASLLFVFVNSGLWW